MKQKVVSIILLSYCILTTSMTMCTSQQLQSKGRSFHAYDPTEDLIYGVIFSNKK